MFKILPINKIVVANRRREDFGNVEKLSESISKYGLFHPPVVDSDNNLIAGERRLRACKLLGFVEIPVRFYSELSDKERDEIELEENLQRKDLTSYEQSKTYAKLAETTKQILQNQESIIEPYDYGADAEEDLGLKSDIVSQKSPDYTFGRPVGTTKPDNLKAVAQRLGISEKTIIRAKQHVEAVDKYPEIVHVPTQKDAIAVAKILDSVDEKKQTEIREDLAKGKVGEVTKLVNVPEPEQLKSKDPAANWGNTIYKIMRTLNSIKLHGGIKRLWRNWSKQDRLYYLRNVKELAERLNNLKIEMEEELKNEQ